MLEIVQKSTCFFIMFVLFLNHNGCSCGSSTLPACHIFAHIRRLQFFVLNFAYIQILRLFQLIDFLNSGVFPLNCVQKINVLTIIWSRYLISIETGKHLILSRNRPTFPPIIIFVSTLIKFTDILKLAISIKLLF